VIVLSNTVKEGALHLAEKIRKGVEALGISHGKAIADGTITLSIGVSTLIPDNGEPAETLTGLADQGLYQAKEQGRNRVLFNNR